MQICTYGLLPIWPNKNTLSLYYFVFVWSDLRRDARVSRIRSNWQPQLLVTFEVRCRLFIGIRLCLICFPREETSPIVQSTHCGWDSVPVLLCVSIHIYCYTNTITLRHMHIVFSHLIIQRHATDPLYLCAFLYTWLWLWIYIILECFLKWYHS